MCAQYLSTFHAEPGLNPNVMFLLDYLILSHYLTAYHWDCLSFIVSPIPSTVHALYYPVTCLSGLVIFYLV
jgi:hypothetical protein